MPALHRSHSLCLPALKGRVKELRNAGRSILLSRQPIHDATGEDILLDDGNISKIRSAVHRPPPMFPWRHEEEPLPRLIPGTHEYKYHGNIFGPSAISVSPFWQNIQTAFGGSYLQVPWYRLLGNAWKQELADSSSFAFSQAVSGVLHNTYNLSQDDIRGDQFDVDLDAVVHAPSLSSVPDRNVENTDLKQEKAGEEEEETEEETQQQIPDLEDMVDQRLRHLYESAHQNGKDQMQIRLQMKPTSAKLLSAFIIPFLTRDIVTKKPSLHEAYPIILRKFLLQQQERGQTFGLVESIKFLIAEFENVRLDTLEYHDTHTISRGTGIVQVLVMCDEVFCVSDLATGKVYQGYNDGKVRSVPHVVRLEVDMSYTISETVSFDEMGSFRIVDWDDLLEGNIWYL